MAHGVGSASMARLDYGFTLVELLIASTMIAVLFVGLGTHLRGGLTVWQRATYIGQMLQRRRVAFDRLERELANAIVYDARQGSYGPDEGQLPWPQFGETSVQFFTVAPASSRQPATVRFVTYACGRVDGTEGLWRTSQSAGASRARNAVPAPTLVVSGCESLSFRYAYRAESQEKSGTIEWRPDWPDDPNEPLKQPRLIEVSLDVSGRRAQRVVALTTGVLGKPQAPPPSP